jgi:hypothetical protein
MKKRVAAISLALILVAMVLPVQAQAQTIGIMPLYTNTSSISVFISFSGTQATCEADVIGKTSTSKISITLSIQRLESNGTYTTVKTWPEESKNSGDFYLSKTYTCEKGKSYRTHVTAKVTRNGTTETVTSNSGTVKCP